MPLSVNNLHVVGDRGTLAVRDLSLAVAAGEILGIAGVSGNGQRELVEALVGPARRASRARSRCAASPTAARREENHRLKVRSLPEEPLRNACVRRLSAWPRTWRCATSTGRRCAPAAGCALAAGAAARATGSPRYGVKTQGEDAPIRSLSGGNVQRAVLARELDGDINVLIAANPVFGLDFAAVKEIHGRMRGVRERGGAVLLISEDLDELLELADRIVVMSEGRIVFETPAANAERHVLGAHMGGGHSIAQAACRSAQDMVIRLAAQPFALPIRDRQHRPRHHRHAARLHRARRLRRNAGQRRVAARGHRAGLPAVLAAWRDAGGLVVHTREAHPPDLSDCPPAKRNRGNPTLRIGDVGPMGRVLVSRRAGQPDHRRAGAAAAARS